MAIFPSRGTNTLLAERMPWLSENVWCARSPGRSLHLRVPQEPFADEHTAGSIPQRTVSRTVHLSSSDVQQMVLDMTTCARDGNVITIGTTNYDKTCNPCMITGVEVNQSLIQSLRDVECNEHMTFAEYVDLYFNEFHKNVLAEDCASKVEPFTRKRLHVLLFGRLYHVWIPNAWERTLHDVQHGSLSFLMEVADVYLYQRHRAQRRGTVSYGKMWYYRMDKDWVFLPEHTDLSEVPSGAHLMLDYADCISDDVLGGIAAQCNHVKSVQCPQSNLQFVRTSIDVPRPYAFCTDVDRRSRTHTYHLVNLIACGVYVDRVQTDDTARATTSQLLSSHKVMGIAVNAHYMSVVDMSARDVVLVNRLLIVATITRSTAFIHPLDTVMNFRATVPALRPCVEFSMNKSYIAYINVRGDGDCFYRALFISALITSIRINNPAPIRRVLDVLRHYATTITHPHITGSVLQERWHVARRFVADWFDAHRSAREHIDWRFMRCLSMLHAAVTRDIDESICCLMRHAIASNINENTYIRSDFGLGEQIDNMYNRGEYMDSLAQFVPYVFETPIRVIRCADHVAEPTNLQCARVNAVIATLSREGDHYSIMIPRKIESIRPVPMADFIGFERRTRR